jgi:hypothetical protein
MHGRGGRGKQNGKTTYICASAQNKVRTYLLFFLIAVFSAVLGVSWQGEFENTGGGLSAFPQSPPGKHFFGGWGGLGGIFWSLDFLLLR